MKKRPPLAAEQSQSSDGGLGAEDSLEARAGELDADDAFAIGEWLGDVDDAALSLKFGIDAASDILGWNANLQIGADRDVKASAKSGAPAAKIFAGSVFLERKSTCVATADA